MINSADADEIMKGILSSPRESRALEFKPSFSWPSKDDLLSNPKAQEVIEATLAMSNLPDGGKIILGVENSSQTDKTLICKGVTAEHLKTYDQDVIFNIVRNCGDPEPSFQILNVLWNGMHFVVFAVQRFTFTPVISTTWKHLRQDSRSVLFIRTDKPETKKVTAPAEMRDIIELAVERELETFSTRMQRVFRTMSQIKVPKSSVDDQEKFANEMDDL
jgi:predicted HTH transcriptional regulator